MMIGSGSTSPSFRRFQRRCRRPVNVAPASTHSARIPVDAPIPAGNSAAAAAMTNRTDYGRHLIPFAIRDNRQRESTQNISAPIPYVLGMNA